MIESSMSLNWAKVVPWGCSGGGWLLSSELDEEPGVVTLGRVLVVASWWLVNSPLSSAEVAVVSLLLLLLEDGLLGRKNPVLNREVLA